MDYPPAPPVNPGPMYAQSNSESNLRVLSIFYFVFGGLNFLMTCGGILYLFLGTAMMANPEMMTNGDQATTEQEAKFAGGIMLGMGGCLIVGGILGAVLMIVTGLNLQKRKGYTFCQVVAGLTCLSVPLGTILGVFTFIVLSRPEVKAMFGRTT